MKIRVPLMVVLPVTANVTFPIVAVAPEGTVSVPATLSTPLPEPAAELPLFSVNPPVPTFVVLVWVQVKVPLTTRERQEPVFPFIVMVCPAATVTLSVAPGTVPVDQVLPVAQLPLATLVMFAAFREEINPRKNNIRKAPGAKSLVVPEN